MSTPARITKGVRKEASEAERQAQTRPRAADLTCMVAEGQRQPEDNAMERELSSVGEEVRLGNKWVVTLCSIYDEAVKPTQHKAPYKKKDRPSPHDADLPDNLLT